MITGVATFDLNQAHKALLRGFPSKHPFADGPRAWLGFECPGSAADVSPLHRAGVQPSCVVVCRDWDVDGRHAPALMGPVIVDHVPSPAIAEQIVRFMLELHRAPDGYALCVHCHAGLWRSGAVAEFARVDLGAPEPEASNRLVDVLVGGPWDGDRIYNRALLRMMRAAHEELRRSEP